MGFQQGLSGLNTSSRGLDAVGNNIANTGTVGFKAATAQFADVYAAALVGGSVGKAVGQGGSVMNISQAFTQGNITSSSNPLDIAINGNGFLRFQPTLNDATANYSRNGQLHLDASGYVVNAQDQYLNAFVSPDGINIDQTEAVPIQISAAQLPPRVTGFVNSLTPGTGGLAIGLNLDVRDKRSAIPVSSSDAANLVAASNEYISTIGDVTDAEDALARADDAKTNASKVIEAATTDSANNLVPFSNADISATLAAVTDVIGATAAASAVGAVATESGDALANFYKSNIAAGSPNPTYFADFANGVANLITSFDPANGAFDADATTTAFNQLVTTLQDSLNADAGFPGFLPKDPDTNAPIPLVGLADDSALKLLRESTLDAIRGKETGLAASAAGNLTNFTNAMNDLVDVAETASAIAQTTAAATDAKGWASLQEWDFATLNPNMYNYSTSASVFDQRGESHILTMYFVRNGVDDGANKFIGSNSWTPHFVLDNKYEVPAVNAVNASTKEAGGTVDFTSSGQLDITEFGNLWYLDIQNATNTSGITTDLSVFPNDLFPEPSFGGGYDLSIDMANATQFGSGYDVNRLTQDGYAPGRISGISIDASGNISARYSNGQTQLQGQISLSSFQNPNGLVPLGNNMWGETAGSGAPLLGSPNSGSRGSIQAGAVEEANVDLTQELVAMIVLQRSYQANAQTIKTQDSVLQTLVNLR